MRSRLTALSEALGRPLSPAELDRFEAFARLVRTWNAKLDLTAARSESALAEVLFGDAIVMSGFIKESVALLDVGSGAGAPAIGFSILRPDCTLTLLEPLRKRVAFLRSAIGSLELTERVSVVEGRIDPDAPRTGLVEAFDLAAARATFAPERWQQIGLALAPACLVFGVDDVPKGADRTHEYRLPESGARRILALYTRNELP